MYRFILTLLLDLNKILMRRCTVSFLSSLAIVSISLVGVNQALNKRNFQVGEDMDHV